MLFGFAMGDSSTLAYALSEDALVSKLELESKDELDEEQLVELTAERSDYTTFTNDIIDPDDELIGSVVLLLSKNESIQAQQAITQQPMKCSKQAMFFLVSYSPLVIHWLQINNKAPLMLAF